MSTFRLLRAALVAALVLPAACRRQQQGFTMPPAEVSVVQVQPKNVAEPVEFMGTVDASRSVDVRSQVTGVIFSRPYVEGSLVHTGDVLFRIDTTSYAAAYLSAQGRLADARARAANAQRNVERLRPLLQDSAVARREVDDAEAELQRASAAVTDAQGAVDRARKDYDDTFVRAQLTGRVRRASFVVGARVTGPNDLLTTIDALDPIYVTFRPSAQQVLAWKRDPEMARAVAPGGSARVQVQLADGSILPRTGEIGYVDPAVDPMTGTQAYRATFTNDDHVLVPGQFVRVKVLGLTLDSAIVIPQRAIQQTLGHQYVYVVKPGDSVASRDVTTGETLEGNVVIASGLNPGDRVIVDGIQKTGPGRVVKPVPLVEGTGSAAGSTPPSRP